MQESVPLPQICIFSRSLCCSSWERAVINIHLFPLLLHSLINIRYLALSQPTELSSQCRVKARNDGRCFIFIHLLVSESWVHTECIAMLWLAAKPSRVFHDTCLQVTSRGFTWLLGIQLFYWTLKCLKEQAEDDFVCMCALHLKPLWRHKVYV